MNQEIVKEDNIIRLNTNQSSLALVVYSFVVFIFIYLIIIRPNKKRVSEYKKNINSFSIGDEIIVNGIYGKIKNIKDNVIDLEISKNITIKIDKNIAYLSKK